jgi:hypothetical protein
MSRRAIKVVAISYAVKTLLFVGLWLLAPDLVRQGRDRARAFFSSLTGAVPASAAIREAAPHGAAGAVLRPAAGAAAALAQPAVLKP